ncbi:DUF4153 domain-containing protein [uncultured Campylobacter sp.]|uniref:DUF4153 domain-containing protein n=1 Tax=uncultured Campylobacter sp. TaxID=218934 RepID=UPI00261B2098|nr:DUF4153 domain-containing protein [uncultured Campylobacter sp.]
MHFNFINLLFPRSTPRDSEPRRALIVQMLHSFKRTFKAHKIESCVIIAFSLLYAVSPNYILEGYSNETTSHEIYLHLPLFLIAIYLCRRAKLAYAAAALIPIVGTLALVLYDPNGTQSLVLFVVAFVLLLSDGFLKENENFVRAALRKLLNLALAAIVALVFLLVCVLVFNGLEYLFGFPWPPEEKFYTICFFALSSWIFMANEDEPKAVNAQFLEKILYFLLTPALALYTIILYAYIVRIALFSGLPRGGVAYIVLNYLACGFILQALFLASLHRRWEKFYRFFALLAVAPIALLWLGIAERVGEYGLTPERIYLCGLAALASVIYAMRLSKILFSYRTVAVLFVSALIVLFFVIDTKQITLYSQLPRFNALVSELGITPQNFKTQLRKIDQDSLSKLRDLAGTIRRSGGEFKPIPQLLDDQVYSSYSKFYSKNFWLNLNVTRFDISKYKSMIALDGKVYCSAKCRITADGFDEQIDVNAHLRRALQEAGADPDTEQTQDFVQKLAPRILQVGSGGRLIIFERLSVNFSESGYEARSFDGAIVLEK